MIDRRLFLSGLAATGLGLTTGGHARAGAYPDHLVTIVVPFPPGGNSDIVGRRIADRLSSVLGQSVILEYRPGGAGGMVGASRLPVLSLMAIRSCSALRRRWSLRPRFTRTSATIRSRASPRSRGCSAFRSCWPSIRRFRRHRSKSLSHTPRRIRELSILHRPATAPSPTCSEKCCAWQPASTSFTYPTRAPRRRSLIC